jgi:GTP-binding protein HflX
VSAKTAEGIPALQERCREWIAHELGSIELLVPHDRYDIVARLHALGHIQSQEHCEEGVRIRGRFPAGQGGVFAPFVVKPGDGREAARPAAPAGLA